MPTNDAPIGVFDSGVGGLSVLKKLGQSFPDQSWIYLGDTARLPYGTKSGPTIKTYTEENLTFLRQFNCRAFIIACNSASTQFPDDTFNGIPVFKVIRPGAVLAAKTTRNNKIGIIGTKATINSRVYEKELTELGFKGNTFTQACPLFVPLVEDGLFEGPIAKLVIERYLKSMRCENIDTLILGCTHYPLLAAALKTFFGNAVTLVSSEPELIASLTKSGNISSSSMKPGSITVYTTDRVEFVSDLAKSILSENSQTIEFKNLNR